MDGVLVEEWPRCWDAFRVLILLRFHGCFEISTSFEAEVLNK
jgi:hypothetical protein